MNSFVFALALVMSAGSPETVPPRPGPSLRFVDYPAGTGIGTRTLDVDLSDAFVRRYRTLLRQELANGPDFAGHYRVVSIGMGTGLVTVVILDTSDGTVFNPDQLQSVFYPRLEDDERARQYGLTYRLDSRLLVVRGVPAIVEAVGTYFFEFRGGRLIFVRGFRWARGHN